MKNELRAAAGAVCALPVMPSGTFSCPDDTGVMYWLTFNADGQKFPAVDVDASGCGQVRGLDQTRWTIRSPGFWPTLGMAMGLAFFGQSAFIGY